MCIGTFEIKRAHLTFRRSDLIGLNVCIGTFEVKKAHLSIGGSNLSGLKVQRHI